MARFSSSCALLLLALPLLSCGGSDAENQGQGLSVSSRMTVTATAGLVSIEAQNAPLGALLAELGRQVEITINVPEEMKAERLTLALQDRSLEDALRQVLAGQSYSFLYRQEKGREAIAGVRLFAQQRPRNNMASFVDPIVASSPVNQGQPPLTGTRSWGRGGTAIGEGKPGAVSDDLSLDELKRSLTDSQDPAQRSATLDAIANRGEDGPVNPIVAQALTDADLDVREAALNLLKSSFDPVPIDSLASMVAREADPDLRIEAMTLMTDQLLQDGRTKDEWAAVSASLSKSLTDHDQDVRDQAEQLLSQLSESEASTVKQGFGQR